MAIGQGADDLILAQIQGLGSRTIVVIPGREPKGPTDPSIVETILSDSLKEREFEALKRKDRTSPEEAELYKLEKDDTSWLSVAKEMRDYSTHVAAVARNFYIRVGVESWESLRNPKTDQEIPGHFLDVFAGWLNKMESLLERLRKSAIATNRSGLGLP